MKYEWGDELTINFGKLCCRVHFDKIWIHEYYGYVKTRSYSVMVDGYSTVHWCVSVWASAINWFSCKLTFCLIHFDGRIGVIQEFIHTKLVSKSTNKLNAWMLWLLINYSRFSILQIIRHTRFQLSSSPFNIPSHWISTTKFSYLEIILLRFCRRVNFRAQ